MAEQQHNSALKVEHLKKSHGEQLVLNDISFVAQQGDVIALLGQSGSGKSTLLRCINLLNIPDAGDIYIGAEKIHLEARSGGKQVLKNHQQVLRLRSQIGMVFQQFNLWPHMTVLENIIEAPMHVLKQKKKVAVTKAESLLEKVGLADKQAQYPSQLSGGQQQRVAIARALAMEPQILLFDEPTSALDPEMVGEVLGVMRQLAQEGTTMLVATHEMGFAREVASHVMFLHQGCIDAFGESNAMFSMPPSERFKQFIQQDYK